MQEVNDLKFKGNSHFSAKEYILALDFYTRALSSVASLRCSSENLGDLSCTEDEELLSNLYSLKISLHSNQAACFLSLDRFDECIHVRLFFYSDSFLLYPLFTKRLYFTISP